MPNQTVTRATESDREPAAIYEVLAEVSNLPKWAPVFADAVERVSERRVRVTKGAEAFQVEVLLNEAAGTVDYVREMSNGRRGGAYIRVTPRPVGGSTVTMTVPVGPNTSDLEVGRTVEQELAELTALAQ
jgi:hypothetical protein